MISKSHSIFSKIVSSTCHQVRNLSKSSKIFNKIHNEKNEICYSTASPSDFCNIIKFFERNYIKFDPLINALFPNGAPSNLQNYFIDEISSSKIQIIAKKINNQEIVGVSIGSILTKNKDKRISRFYKQDRCNTHMEKYFEVLSELYQAPKLNMILCADEILRVNAVTADKSCEGQKIAKNLITKSFEYGIQEKIPFASIHCTSDDMNKIAEALNCEKVWSICYRQILQKGKIGKYNPPSFPCSPNDSMNVFVKRLCKNLNKKLI